MKFNCKDPLVQQLKKHGYGLVLLPREGVAPLQIIARSEKGIWAWVKDFFKTPVLDDKKAHINELLIADSQPLPNPTSEDVANDLKGKRSSDLSVEMGVALMMNFLKLPEEAKTETKKLELKTALQSVDKMSFAFGGDANAQSISHVALDSFLKDAVIRSTVGHTFKEMIDKNQIYIITSVLKSNSFTIKGSSNDKASAKINLPKIKNILEGKIEGSLDVFEQSGIKYKGEKVLVFGFKAVRLLSKKTKNRYQFSISTQDGLALKNDEEFAVDLMENDTNFVNI